MIQRAEFQYINFDTLIAINKEKAIARYSSVLIPTQIIGLTRKNLPRWGMQSENRATAIVECVCKKGLLSSSRATIRTQSID
jgi:hypothetical protein